MTPTGLLVYSKCLVFVLYLYFCLNKEFSVELFPVLVVSF